MFDVTVAVKSEDSGEMGYAGHRENCCDEKNESENESECFQ